VDAPAGGPSATDLPPTSFADFAILGSYVAGQALSPSSTDAELFERAWGAAQAWHWLQENRELLINGASLAMAAPGRPVSQPIGGVITGYAVNRAGVRHGLNQAISRPGGGVSPRAMLAAVKNPLRIVQQAGGGTTQYIGPNAVVVVNARGQIVTTWATNSAGLRWR